MPRRREDAVAEGVFGVDVGALLPVSLVRLDSVVKGVSGEVVNDRPPKKRDGWPARESVIRCNLYHSVVPRGMSK